MFVITHLAKLITMNSEETLYPQYRKYDGVDTWYKIVSADLFIELKKVGKHIVIEEWQEDGVLIRDASFIEIINGYKGNEYAEVSELFANLSKLTKDEVLGINLAVKKLVTDKLFG